MPSVRIDGWKPGLQKVEMTKALQHHAGFSLTAAKQATDEVVSGETVTVQCSSRQAAIALESRLTQLGANAAVARET